MNLKVTQQIFAIVTVLSLMKCNPTQIKTCFNFVSNCKEPGIAGVMTIVKESYPDHTQFDSKDVHFDAKAQKENPRWFMVDVKYERMLKRYITLAELKKLHNEHKQTDGPLKSVALFTRARLSVQPLTKEEFDFILTLEKEKVEDKG